MKIKNFSEELLRYKDKNDLDIPGTERNTSDGNVTYNLNSQGYGEPPQAPSTPPPSNKNLLLPDSTGKTNLGRKRKGYPSPSGSSGSSEKKSRTDNTEPVIGDIWQKNILPPYICKDCSSPG